MLSNATSSALPAGPLFPPLSRNEMQILAQIMGLTPPNTTAFNALLTPYQETLRRHKLDPKTDERFYTLLLKLSLVPGVDWRRKWERVVSEQPRLEPSVQTRQKPTTNTSAGQTTALQSISARVQPQQNRVPVYPRSTIHASGPGQHGRPQKSVHFLPVKESLPVKRQPSAVPATMTLSPVIKSNFSQLIDYADVKARNLRRLQLLRHFLGCWQNHIVHWNNLGVEAERARGIIDVSTAFQVWRRKAQNLRARFNATANVHDSRILGARLTHWRRLTIRKQERKWLLIMNQTCLNIRRMNDRALCRQVLILWSNHVKSSRFFITSSRQFVHRLLIQWHCQLQHHESLNILSMKFVKRSNARQRRRLFARWNRKTFVTSQLRQLIHVQSLKQKGHAFSHWRYMSAQSRLGKTFFQKLQLRKFITAWRRLYKHQLMLSNAAARVLILRDQNTKLQTLRRWVVSERGIFLESARNTRLLRVYLTRWKYRLEYIAYDLPRLQDRFMSHASTYRAKIVIQIWKQRYARSLAREAQADCLCRRAVARRILSAWTFQRINSQRTEAQADASRIRFLKIRILRIWRRKAHRKKVRHWVRHRRTEGLRKVFHAWMHAVQTRKRTLSCLMKFNRVCTLHKRSQIFTRWREKFASTRKQEQTACQLYRTRSTQKFWTIWNANLDSIEFMGRKADSVLQRRDEDYKADLLDFWSRRTRERMLLADFARGQRLKARLSSWGRWREQTRLKQLQAQGTIIARSTARSCKTRAWQSWTSRSFLLLRIRHSKLQTLTRYLGIWRDSARMKAQLVLAYRLDRTKLYKAFFKLWLERYMDSKASRMISRLKNHRTFAQPLNGRRAFNQRLPFTDDDETTPDYNTSIDSG